MTAAIVVAGVIVIVALLAIIAIVRTHRSEAELEAALRAADVDFEQIDELELRRRQREADLKRFLSSATPPASANFVVTADGRVYQLIDGELREARDFNVEH